MSDRTQWPTAAGDGAHDDGAVESLLRLAGPREPVPPERMQRLKAAAHAEWRQHARARRRRLAVASSFAGLAAAAAVVLALRLTGSGGLPGEGAAAFATVEALSGTAQLTARASGQESVAVSVGDRIAAGRDTLSLARGTATLRLERGALLRMEGGTALLLASGGAVVLDRGAVYVDSDGGAPLEVRTRLGVVRDVGTQFEVRLTPAGLRVRVRDGAVQVRRDQQQHEARAGDEVLLDASGRLTRRTVPVDDPAWAWTTGAAPPFEIEGRSLREFLEWVAGENGWRLQFADAAVEDKTRTTTLHGSIQGLTPEQALAAVLPTSGVEHRLDGGVLLIRLDAGAKD